MIIKESKQTQISTEDTKTIADAIKIIQGLCPHDNDMSIELWGKNSALSGMLRIGNSCEKRGLFIDTTNKYYQASEIYSDKEINYRKKNNINS